VLGVFEAAGVMHLRLQREADAASVGDLLVHGLDELEAVTDRKGSMRRLLVDQWAKLYWANTSLKPALARAA
jgi:hypothetical protein